MPLPMPPGQHTLNHLKNKHCSTHTVEVVYIDFCMLSHFYVKSFVFKLLVEFPRGGQTPMPPGKPLGTAPGRMEGSMLSCLTIGGQGIVCLVASPPPAAMSPSRGLASRDNAL